MTSDVPDEWEEFIIRVKKDPAWPYHGTFIEFNQCRYVRSDKVEELRAAVKALHEELLDADNAITHLLPFAKGYVHTHDIPPNRQLIHVAERRKYLTNELLEKHASIIAECMEGE